MSQFLTCRSFYTGILLVGVLFSGSALSEIRITPVVGLEESFISSETATQDESGQITKVSPGVRIVASGARSSASLEYDINAINYQNLDQDDEVNQSLTLDSSLTHIPERWVSFLKGNIRQAIISPDGPQVLNTDFQSDNTEEFRTLSVGTKLEGIWTDVITYRTLINADYADFESSDDTDSVSATLVFESNSSGNFNWQTAFTTKTTTRGDNESEVDTINIDLGYKFSLRYQGFLSVEKNDTGVDFLDETETLVGIQWVPNQSSSVSFGAGKRGDDTTYTLDSQLTTRRVTYSLDYQESVTSTRNLLVDQSINEVALSPTSQDFSIEPLLVKKANMAVTLVGRRTNLSIAYLKQITERSENNTDEEEVDGLRLGAIQKLSPQSSAQIFARRQQRDSDEENRVDDISLSYSRQASEQLDWSVELRKTRQTSDIVENEIEQDLLAFRLRASF